MVILRKEEMRHWLNLRKIEIAADKAFLHYSSSDVDGIEFDIPECKSAIGPLSNSLTNGGDDSYFGSLLWVSEWAIFGALSDKIGIKLFKQFCMSYDQAGAFQMGFGCLFDPTEELDQAALLLVVLLSEWDAFLVPSHASFFTFVSHDGFFNIVTDAPDEVHGLLERYASHNPKRKVRPYLRLP